jgi:hypothetical protein
MPEPLNFSPKAKPANYTYMPVKGPDVQVALTWTSETRAQVFFELRLIGEVFKDLNPQWGWRWSLPTDSHLVSRGSQLRNVIDALIDMLGKGAHKRP